MKKLVSLLLIAILMMTVFAGAEGLKEAYEAVEGQAYVDVAALPDYKANEPYKIGLAMTSVATG